MHAHKHYHVPTIPTAHSPFPSMVINGPLFSVEEPVLGEIWQVRYKQHPLPLSDLLQFSFAVISGPSFSGEETFKKNELVRGNSTLIFAGFAASINGHGGEWHRRLGQRDQTHVFSPLLRVNLWVHNPPMSQGPVKMRMINWNKNGSFHQTCTLGWFYDLESHFCISYRYVSQVSYVRACSWKLELLARPWHTGPFEP